MDHSRISHVIDAQALKRKSVAVVGCGGSAGLARNLVRCGVGWLRLVDPDSVGGENLCRQEHMADQIGQFKTWALEQELKRINPDVRTQTMEEDFCNFTDGEIARRFGTTDLFVFATDNHKAQARGNEACLRLNKPAVWIGLYPQGMGGEVAYWKPGLASCYRCLLSHRYAAQEQGAKDPPSAGADVLAVSYLDALAGMVILGLLTEGADDRYGRLIASLGGRQFLQVKIDPQWGWNGRDVIRERLQIPDGNDAYAGFCMAALRDPEPGGKCLDCLKYRRDLPAAALAG